MGCCTPGPSAGSSHWEDCGWVTSKGCYGCWLWDTMHTRLLYTERAEVLTLWGLCDSIKHSIKGWTRTQRNQEGPRETGEEPAPLLIVPHTTYKGMSVS